VPLRWNEPHRSGARMSPLGVFYGVKLGSFAITVLDAAPKTRGVLGGASTSPPMAVTPPPRSRHCDAFNWGTVASTRVVHD
jgi:hypothetical protein